MASSSSTPRSSSAKKKKRKDKSEKKRDKSEKKRRKKDDEERRGTSDVRGEESSSMEVGIGDDDNCSPPPVENEVVAAAAVSPPSDKEDGEDRRKEKKKKDKKKKKKRKDKAKTEEDAENDMKQEREEDGREKADEEVAAETKEGRKKKKKNRREKKEKKRDKKDKDKKKRKRGDDEGDGDDGVSRSASRKKRKRSAAGNDDDGLPPSSDDGSGECAVGGRVAASSALTKPKVDGDGENGGVTLLLFYQYVDPPWDASDFKKALQDVEDLGLKHGLTGRMRVATEGLNCTLTGTREGVRRWCRDLRNYGERGEFRDTEFKLTDDLPKGQLFPKLHAFKVDELVNYGLAGEKAPPIGKTGVHLEPDDYHRKMAEGDTVIIDVRNHYEANIGQFVPPPDGAEYVDPGMRKSTEFPLWLDRPETKEKLRGKQVLMYCTGGVRCERASALLKHKMETEDDTKELGIKGVYQLQGGIDKYFKEFPGGGWWKGKNYVFDKRFAHAPPEVEGNERAAAAAKLGSESDGNKGAASEEGETKLPEKMGRCESCQKPWDMYRGKRRCPTCGVPSLICRDCMEAADKAKQTDGKKKKKKKPKLSGDVRCDLCVKEGITKKSQVRERERRELEEYERKKEERERNCKGVEDNSSSAAAGWSNDGDNDVWAAKEDGDYGGGYGGGGESAAAAANPNGITRLFLKNMCSHRMDEATLLEYFPSVTHVLWVTDRRTGQFYGSAQVEMATPEDAANAVAMDGIKVFGRNVRIQYDEPDPKDVWPPRHCKIGYSNW